MTDHQSENQNRESLDYYLEEDSMSLSDILLILARHIRIILITPMILCTFTIIDVLFIADPVYTSTSKIMSSSGGGNVSQAVGLAAQFGINIPTGQSESKWSYLEIIKSRTLARSILKRKYDTEEFGLQKSLLQILTYGNNHPEFGLDILEIIAVDHLLEMIEVSDNIKTAVYTVDIHASEPRLAAEINKVLIEELDIYQQEYNSAKTSETRQFIEERIVDTEKELQISEDALRDFATRNRHIENSPLLLLEQQRLAREVTVLMGVFTTLKQQLETTKIEEVRKSVYVVVLDPPEVPLMRSKPKKKKMVILAGLLGIGLGIGIAFVWEYFRNNEEKEKKKLMKAQSLLIKDFTQIYHTLLRFLKAIIPFKLK